ncbi:hypothetical protein BV25DRAFT_1922118 [Artomyces pyxidatus]|uniref:Uncharacterized protein n=1 Tax=Artomyces pyxidatus TaxID=48021 RepID=A0ACB8SFD0_9AGAM|nr:hypothetical protein BV25DRAFT_1922118 [Artomyces pyxidatus]
MTRGKDGFFVVLKGRQTGIFEGWLTAGPLVNKYSGNEYKSYNTLEEAQEAWDRAMSKRDPRAIEDNEGDVADISSSLSNVHISSAASTPQRAHLRGSLSSAMPGPSSRTPAAAYPVSPSPSRGPRSPAAAYPASPSPSRAPRLPAANYPASPSRVVAAAPPGHHQPATTQSYGTGASSPGMTSPARANTARAPASSQPAASSCIIAPPLTREDIDSAPDGNLWYAIVRGREEGVFPGPLENIRNKIIDYENTFFRGFETIEDAGEWFVEHFAD